MSSFEAAAALRETLKEREMEVQSLNKVLMQQGRELMASSASGKDDALKRKEALVRASQARVEKLEAQNAALRDELIREEHLRREADQRYQQATKALQAQAEHMAGSAALGLAAQPSSTSLQRGGPAPEAAPSAGAAARGGEAVEAKLHAMEHALAKAEERATTLYSESAMLRTQLAETQELLTAAKKEVLEKEKAVQEAARHARDGGGAGASDGARRPRSFGGPGHGAISETEMEAVLPSEAYAAMKEQRRELTGRVEELEHKLSVAEAQGGSAARLREHAAHQSMVDRCTHLAAQVRHVESQLARTSAALHPTKLALQKKERLASELGQANLTLRDQHGHESALRVRLARMALIAYKGLCDALPELIALGNVGAQVRPAVAGGRHGGGGGGDGGDPAGGETTGGAAWSEELDARLSGLNAILRDAIDAVDHLAPFSSPHPRHARLTTVDQLAMLADEPPPPDLPTSIAQALPLAPTPGTGSALPPLHSRSDLDSPLRPLTPSAALGGVRERGEAGWGGTSCGGRGTGGGARWGGGRQPAPTEGMGMTAPPAAGAVASAGSVEVRKGGATAPPPSREGSRPGAPPHSGGRDSPTRRRDGAVVVGAPSFRGSEHTHPTRSPTRPRGATPIAPTASAAAISPPVASVANGSHSCANHRASGSQDTCWPTTSTAAAVSPGGRPPMVRPSSVPSLASVSSGIVFRALLEAPYIGKPNTSSRQRAVAMPSRPISRAPAAQSVPPASGGPRFIQVSGQPVRGVSRDERVVIRPMAMITPGRLEM